MHASSSGENPTFWRIEAPVRRAEDVGFLIAASDIAEPIIRAKQKVIRKIQPAFRPKP
jgi:hypothetical protein